MLTTKTAPPTSVLLTVFLVTASVARADTFHVTPNGRDGADRDGRSVASAWASLAYACERVPEGPHRIQLAPGKYVATRTARPKSGVTIAGAGMEGRKSTQIIAAPDWPLSGNTLRDLGPAEEHLIALTRIRNVTVRDLMLASMPEHRITGALRAQGCQELVIERVAVEEFRWSGLALETCAEVAVRGCLLQRASMEKHAGRGGLLRTRWLKNSEICGNRILAGEGDGYGYKGSGHERVGLHHNLIRAPYFAIESAHENEFGLEIDHNQIHGCISVPKGGQGADPSQRGCQFSVRIHHNLMTDSYAVEGPRNHLRLDHNYIRVEKPNGRIYTHHGGTNHGPVWIHHNIVENADRAFVWMNQGLAENLFVFNNTVFFADAGDRTGSILGASHGDRLNGWVVRNNVFICPPEKPRRLFPAERGVPAKISVVNNLCLNVAALPDGNFTADRAGFTAAGAKPIPFFSPRPGGNLDNRGVAIDLPFAGPIADLGAVQHGAKQEFSDLSRLKAECDPEAGPESGHLDDSDSQEKASVPVDTCHLAPTVSVGPVNPGPPAATYP